MAPLSIGRSRSCSIVVESPTVSRHHADLTEVGGDRYRFEDCGSTSGSYRLEDGAWQQFERAELGRDERVRLGDFECTLGELLGRLRQVERRQVERRQVEGRQVEDRQVESMQVEDRQVEGLQVEAQQVESRPVESKPPRTVIERDPATGQIVVRKL